MQEKIIGFLKQSKGYVSGEDMSGELKISRAAVWKYIDQLRHEGYDIAAVPHLGYKLEDCPDKLLPHEITFGLKTKRLGQNAMFLDTVGSSMDEAFRLGMEGAPEGTIVCAETQTKGRGRLGRRWASPKGKGIYASLILRPHFAPAQTAQLTLMTAVAIAQALTKISGIKIEIKWPNDLLVGGRKLAGILTELRAEMDQVEFVVIGFGINVNSTAQNLVEGSTSLKMETGNSFSRVLVLQELLVSLEFWYDGLKKQGFQPVLKAWKSNSATLKTRVRVTDADGVAEGVAFDLDDDGGLLIRQDSGVVIKKMAGDITQIK